MVPLEVSGKLTAYGCMSRKPTSSEDDDITVFLFRLLLAGMMILSEGGAVWVKFAFPWIVDCPCSSRDSSLDSSSDWKGGTISLVEGSTIVNLLPVQLLSSLK